MIDWVLAADIPVNPSRDAARDAARDELSKPIYDDAQPLIARAILWVLDQLGWLLEQASRAAPGGWWSMIVLIAGAVVAVLVIRRGIGPIGRATRGAEVIFGSRRLSAAEYRRAADEARRRGDWAVAVRERFRATVRSLEERGVLDERAGRTADEAAADAGLMLPSLADQLRAGARVFDEVMYGNHRATSLHDDQLRSLDEAVSSRRPLPTSPSSSAPSR